MRPRGTETTAQVHGRREEWGTDVSLNALVTILYLGLYSRQGREGEPGRLHRGAESGWEGIGAELAEKAKNIRFNMSCTVVDVVGSGEALEGKETGSCSLDCESPHRSSGFTFHSVGTWSQEKFLTRDGTRFSCVFSQMHPLPPIYVGVLTPSTSYRILCRNRVIVDVIKMKSFWRRVDL